MDLTTADFARSVIPRLTPAQELALPGMVDAASRTIQRWCNRTLGYQEGIEQLVTADRGGEVNLREHPIYSVSRVSGAPVPALTISRRGTSAQAARAELPTDDPRGLIGDRLILATRSLGVPATATIEFAGLATPTVGALAAAVNSLPGWLATAEDGFEGWAAAELLAGQGSLDAAGADARFVVYSEEIPYKVDREFGILTVMGARTSDAFESMRFGPVMSLDFGDPGIDGEYQGLRIGYSAGYRAIPADLQLATAELVKATFERMAVSSVLQSERTDVWAWTAREFGEIVGGMPESVRQAVATYRNHA